MKSNQDIDKLFSQKLDSLESAPSTEAWLKLEKNLQYKKKGKKGIIWFPYAAAAAIALLIVSVWLIRGWEKGNTGNMANQSGQTTKTPLADKPAPEVNEPAGNSGTVTQPQNEEKLIAVEKKPDATTKKQVKNPSVTKRNRNTPDTRIHTIQDIEPKATVPTVIEVEEKLALQAPAVMETKLPQQPSVVVIVQVDASAKQAIPDEIASEEVDEPNKQTRAGKLLSSLKKIKKAEFDELGIRPETVVAFVRDKTGKH